MFLDIADSLSCRACRIDRGDIRNACLDGVLPQIAVVVNTVFADRRVDDELYFAISNKVKDIGASLIELLDAFSGNACFLDQIACASRSQDLEAAFTEDRSNFRHFRLILFVDGDQDRSLSRKRRIGSLLCFEVSFTCLVRNAKNFACRAHLGSEYRIDFLEHKTASLTP